MKGMKTKYTALGMALCLAAVTAAGCGKENTEQQANPQTEKNAENGFAPGGQMENQLTEEELAAYEAADQIEIEPLTLISEWEEKAEITLGNTVTVDGNGAAVENETTLSITEGGAYTLTGTLADGMISVDTTEAVKLILNGAAISNGDGPAIFVTNAKSCYIETKKGTENKLEDSSTYAGAASGSSGTETETAKAAVFSNDPLVLLGEGSLQVTGNYKHAVSSDDEIYVESGSYTLKAVKDGMHANNWICVDGGTLEITVEDDGMQSEGAFAWKGGTGAIAADGKGITSYGDMDLSGGTIQITQCTEGLECKNDLRITGGTYEISGSDDGINTRTSLTMEGGTVYAVSSAGDGVDSNGSLTIDGGLLLAFGAAEPEGGIDCDQNEIVINGGTLAAAGGTNSAPSESESKQFSVLLGSAQKGEVIGILNAEGETVFAMEVPHSYHNLLLSADTIKAGTDYTVYSGGTATGDKEFGLYKNGIYQGGTESVAFTTDRTVVSAGGTTNSMGGGMGGHGGSGEMPNGQSPSSGEPPQRPDGERPEESQMPEKNKTGETGQSLEEGTLYPGGNNLENREATSDSV